MKRTSLALVTAVAVMPFLTACVPLIVAGAAGTALVVTDRRSTGAQLDDTTIETKLATEAGSRYGDRLHLNATTISL